ncbi:hypothetical protein EQ821_26590 [Escherichia coli]|nr:hypothetical protein EQ821_26590 [Escherichia coli]
MTRTDLHRCYSPISFTVIRKQKRQHVDPWRASGPSWMASCEQHNIPHKSMRYMAEKVITGATGRRMDPLSSRSASYDIRRVGGQLRLPPLTNR